MIKYALKIGEPEAVAETLPRDEHIAPVPRISIQAFCETAETATLMQAAGEDRRLAKAHIKIQMGGIAAAAEAYRNAPTPNVILIESESRSADLLAGLDRLAEVCDAGTRVITIGRVNDIALYRDLVRRGVSDYLIAPVGVLARAAIAGEVLKWLWVGLALWGALAVAHLPPLPLLLGLIAAQFAFWLGIALIR